MNFPKKLRYRGRVLAVIYGKSKGGAKKKNGGVTQPYPFYRVAGYVAGKRRMASYPTYSEAKSAADALVRDIAKGSQVAALSAGQARDCLAAYERLQRLYADTGKRFSILGAVSEFSEAVAKLPDGQTLPGAMDGFLSNVASVQRKPLSVAVADFLAGRKHLGESKDGKRARHSPVYEYHVTGWLNEFSASLQNYDVCDLTKENLDTYFAAFAELSPKSRNDRRAILKQFLKWCAAKDFLAQNHRLFEAAAFKSEDTHIEEIEFYTPAELLSMLERASKQPAPAKPGKKPEMDLREILPVIALSALGGLRVEECLRLNWPDVWRVEGKIEISARIAKGRRRRLVTMGDSLRQWLEDYREATGPVCALNPMQFNRRAVALREALKIPAKRNGWRHGFVTYHYAMHANENLTAAEAGNSPAMIHEHYRALATAKQAAAWFDVAPAQLANVVQLSAQ